MRIYSFRVPARSGRTDAQVREEVLDAFAALDRLGDLELRDDRKGGKTLAYRARALSIRRELARLSSEGSRAGTPATARYASSQAVPSRSLVQIHGCVVTP